MTFKFNLLFFSLFILFFITEVLIALFLKSGFIRHTFGDYLVVIMLFYGIKSMCTYKSLSVAVGVLSFAFVIEFLQLFNFLTALDLQDNILAKLILGSSFSYQDLIAYTLGITTVLIIDSNFFNK